MKKLNQSILKAFMVSALLGLGHKELEAQTVAKTDSLLNGLSTLPDSTKIPALRLDKNMQEFFQQLGLEPVMTRPTGKNNAPYFLHSDNVLSLPKNTAIVIFQDIPDTTYAPRGTGHLIVPEGMDTTNIAEVIRATCSAAFFKVDSTVSTLSQENLLGYSIVKDWNYAGDNSTVTKREVYMLGTQQRYSARFTTDGTITTVDRVKMLEKLSATPKKAPIEPPVLRGW